MKIGKQLSLKKKGNARYSLLSFPFWLHQIIFLMIFLFIFSLLSKSCDVMQGTKARLSKSDWWILTSETLSKRIL